MEGTKNRVKIPFFIIITYILNLYIGFNYASLQFTLLEMKTEFQISSTLMATITSVQLVTGLLMTFVFSKILDHLDVKKTLLTGFAISIIGTLIAGFSNGPAMTTVSNIVSSIGSNIMMAAPYPILMLLDPTRVTLHVNRQTFMESRIFYRSRYTGGSFSSGTEYQISWKEYGSCEGRTGERRRKKEQEKDHLDTCFHMHGSDPCTLHVHGERSP